MYEFGDRCLWSGDAPPKFPVIVKEDDRRECFVTPLFRMMVDVVKQEYGLEHLAGLAVAASTYRFTHERFQHVRLAWKSRESTHVIGFPRHVASQERSPEEWDDFLAYRGDVLFPFPEVTIQRYPIGRSRE